MMWLQYLLFLCNLTYQPDVGFLALKAESTRQIPISLAACDTLRGTVKTGKNDSGGADLLPSQPPWEAATPRPETTLKAGLPILNPHTHERLGTLKNALRGPPPILWSGTRIGSVVYGRYTLGSPVAPKRVAKEYDIAPHKDQLSPRRPLDSHHGVQKEYLKQNTPGYNEKLDPTILLNRSKHGPITGKQATYRAKVNSEIGSKYAGDYGKWRAESIKQMREQGVPEAKIGEWVLEHDGYLFGIGIE